MTDLAKGETAQPMVDARAVQKKFGGLHVLKGIDLSVQRGEVACLVGPSGSGKTTMLRCINHLEQISGGRLYVDGDLMGYREKGSKLHELHPREAAKQRRDIGMVFQHFNLFPHMSALQNVSEAPTRVKKVRSRDAEGTARELLKRVGFAREVADQLIFMDGGVVVESGPPRDVLGAPRHERTKAFLSKVL